jgi:hypothetical protein
MTHVQSINVRVSDHNEVSGITHAMCLKLR